MAEPLWTSRQIAETTGGEALGSAFTISGLSIDTRTLQPGDLFVARTPERDGHACLAAAFTAGAAGALVSVPVKALPAVRVDETLNALERLAAAARDRSSARRCAVTGSVGKTGVTQAIAAALKLAGASHAPVRSFNNHIGVPLTLAALPRNTRFAVFELGMNHAGEIGPLSRLVRPHVAVVTTVGPVHVENFADGETGVARAKAEIFEGLEPGGVAVLNADDAWFDLLADAAQKAGAKLLSFGSGEGCDAQLLSSRPRAAGREIVARLQGGEINFPIAQAGAHWGPNSLAVLLAAEALGAPLACALEALRTFAPLTGRGAARIVPTPGGAYTLVDESYNANPISMRAALATLAQAPPRRLAVLTDMLELGADAARHHLELAGPIGAADVTAAYLAGPAMRHLHEALPQGRRGVWAADAAELAPVVVAAVRPGDTVMIKGSHGSQASSIVKALLDAAPPPAAGATP